MKAAGSSVTGFEGDRSRPLPTVRGPRPASFVHQQRTPSTGLDFGALAPACSACGNRSPLVDCASGLCPRCDQQPSAAAPTATLTDAERAAEMYATGQTLKQISDRLGRDHRVVRRLLTDQGVTIRPRGGGKDRQRGAA